MKKFLTFVFTVLTAAAVSGQIFEGKITYHNSFRSKMEKLSDEQLNSSMGTVQEYYIKGGNYKSVFNGTFSQWQLYINADNRIYSKMVNSSNIVWNDAGVSDDSVINIQLNKNAAEILGYKCDELIMTGKSRTMKYYFSSALGVDTKLFANHKYGNWIDYL